MLVNLLIGFVLPWILGVYLVYKDKKIILLIGPAASVLAFTVDVLGFQFDYWQIKPFYDNEIYSALPFHLGIYPVLTSFLIYLIQGGKYNSYILIFLITLITTLLELTAVLIGKVVYTNGWNIFLTFFSYLIPYLIAYRYYLTLKKLGLFD